jgi:hypothetical protein
MHVTRAPNRFIQIGICITPRIIIEQRLPPHFDCVPDVGKTLSPAALPCQRYTPRQ